MRTARALFRGCLIAAALLVAAPSAALALDGNSNGGVSPSSGDPGVTGGTPVSTPPSAPIAQPPALGAVTLGGGFARAARGAPRVIRLAVRAGNRLQAKPYRFGGGHASFKDTAYDCSGAVSYVLHAAHLLVSPLDSTDLMSWGEPGPGSWITVYANPSHAFMFVGGLRLDTSGAGASGPRWRSAPRSLDGFVARHPAGL
jgi:hypothetical protein